jgi:DNA topoisomerase VI subunit A
MSKLKDDLVSAFPSIAKEWKKVKRQADKEDRVSSRALERMYREMSRTTIRKAAFDVMDDAYLKASGNGHLPANGRQIYYAARGAILEATGTHELNSQYFEQTLLKDYMEQFNPNWDVVFDDRGHIAEPHTGAVVGLGGIAVRQYIDEFTNGDIPPKPEYEPLRMIPTKGPSLRYGGVLFIEKEGFGPILRRAKIAERFDIAIASTKGMPVSAFCDLLAKLKETGLKAYVVHDFDKSGFSIVSTLRRGARGSKGTGDIIDLGLRLEDIEGLERERVYYNADPESNLRANGATDDEIGILLQSTYPQYAGERVELNAMDSEQLIKWLERKLTEHGVKKMVPEIRKLQAAYRRAVYLQKIQVAVNKLCDQIGDETISVPAKLRDMVREGLKEQPELSWDEVVLNIAVED